MTDNNILKSILATAFFLTAFYAGSLHGRSHNDLIRDAELFYNIGSYANAAETYEKIIATSPVLKAEFFANLARSYSMLGKYQEALEAARKGLRFTQSSWQIYFQQAYAYYKLEDYNRAIEYLTQSINLSPNNSYVYNFMGLVYLQMQEYQKAEEKFFTATTYSPGNPTYLCNLGSSYESQKKYKDALAIYEKALMYDPENKSRARTSAARVKTYLGITNTQASTNTAPIKEDMSAITNVLQNSQEENTNTQATNR